MFSRGGTLLGTEDLPADSDRELLWAQSRFRSMRQGGGGGAKWESEWFERLQAVSPFASEGQGRAANFTLSALSVQ
jgi:hypothetical protein